MLELIDAKPIINEMGKKSAMMLAAEIINHVTLNNKTFLWFWDALTDTEREALKLHIQEMNDDG